MRIPPAASYTLRRLALFAATLALAVALLRGASFLVALLVATVVSSALSYFLLAPQREAMARSLKNLSERLDSSAAAEDAILDAAERERAGGQEAPGTRTTGPKESHP